MYQEERNVFDDVIGFKTANWNYFHKKMNE